MRQGATGMNCRADAGCDAIGVAKDHCAEPLALLLSLATTRQKYSVPALNAPGE
jgi:hypothetical protein